MVVPGKQVSIELVKAMGLPIEGCTSVVIDLPLDHVASIILTYNLTADALRIAGEALSSGQASDG